jgi:hypothetical protein
VTTVMHTKVPLKRLPLSEDGQPRYFHPHGYVIERDTRDWDLGGITRGARHQWSPKHWWNVHEHAGRSAESLAENGGKFLHAAHKTKVVIDCGTLRQARGWCNAHPRDGWPSPSEGGVGPR